MADARGYGLGAIVVHWTSAVLVAGLFASGLWMVGLGYYDPWYHRAPAWHESAGLLLGGLTLARLAWRVTAGTPPLEPTLAPWERAAARTAHWTLYAGLVVLTLSGYLMVTAKGDPADIFGLATIPAHLTDLPRQADRAGLVHLWTAWALIGLTAVHAAGALKHHFIDGDRTLVRMLKPSRDHKAEE